MVLNVSSTAKRGSSISSQENTLNIGQERAGVKTKTIKMVTARCLLVSNHALIVTVKRIETRLRGIISIYCLSFFIPFSLVSFLLIVTIRRLFETSLFVGNLLLTARVFIR